MKATKVTMSIEIEVLSIDAVPALLFKLIEQLQAEFITGTLVADDGDEISWTTEQTTVNF